MQLLVYYRTLENCNSFELGSLEVVMTILGSCMLARAYSLSICDFGSERLFCQISGGGTKDRTYQLELHRKQNPFQDLLQLSSAPWGGLSPLQGSP
jgi:hypothetical protein